MITIGIDPGINGAIGALSAETLLWWAPMPTQPRSVGKGLQVDAHALSDLLSGEEIATQVIIERVAAMPKQGVTSMFGFGRSVGVCEGVCATLELSVSWVTPQRWKRSAGLTGSHKGASITMAQEIWPELREAKLNKAALLGVCDALLIARYGRFEP